MRINSLVLAAFFCLALTGLLAPAAMAVQLVPGQSLATNSEKETPAETKEQGDPFLRENPLSSMLAFLAAAEAFEWDLASNYLDLRNLPADVRQMDGAELAEQLYFIMQRREVAISGDIISDLPKGQAIDDLPEYRDELGRVRTQDGEVKLLLQRVPGPKGLMVWKVSNVTVAKVPALYAEFSYPDWVEKVRTRVPSNVSFLGFELFKWLIVIASAIVLIPAVWVVAYLLARILSKPSSPIWKEIKGLLTGPITALVVMFILRDLAIELGVGATTAQIMDAQTLVTFFSVWFIWSMVNLWRARRRHLYEIEGRSDAAILGRPVANAVKLVTLLIGILVWLANAGVDISALLAGLGIGGIAVALALQKPIEDLFGAISIYSQQPVSTGDLCKYGTSIGRVEEIGLRTTRIRTLSNTLVNVPNAQLSTGIIENLTARTKIMYHPDLPLRYDTSRAQVEELSARLKQALTDNPRVEDETIRVRLVAFTPNAIMLRVRIFALTRNFDEYLEIIEQINLDIMGLVGACKVRFSQGAQTLFIEESNAGAGHPFKATDKD